PANASYGDYMLIFPAIQFNYFAYINVNTTPDVMSYTWLVVVNLSESNMGVHINGSTYPVPTAHFNNVTQEVRVLVPRQHLINFYDTNKMTPGDNLSVIILTRKDFSAYGQLDDLPAAACDLQHVFGYQLLVAEAATTVTNGSRNRREANPAVVN